MADQRFQATEYVVGANHPTLTDTINRLALVEHETDGKHKSGISLDSPTLTAYGEPVNALGDLGGGTDDIDLSSGNVVTATVSTSAETFTFSNPTASGVACGFILILTNGGSQTVNWPASVDWAGGVAPTLTASGVDYLAFITTDGGTTWRGFKLGLDMK